MLFMAPPSTCRLLGFCVRLYNRQILPGHRRPSSICHPSNHPYHLLQIVHSNCRHHFMTTTAKRMDRKNRKTKNTKKKNWKTGQQQDAIISNGWRGRCMFGCKRNRMQYSQWLVYCVVEVCVMLPLLMMDSSPGTRMDDLMRSILYMSMVRMCPTPLPDTAAACN